MPTAEQPTTEQIESVARALHQADHGTPSCACHSFDRGPERSQYIRRAKIAVSAYREALSHV